MRSSRRPSRLAELNQRRFTEKYLDASPDSPTRFEVGARVLMTYPNRPPSKLHPRWRGPLEVIKVDGNTYTVRDVLTSADMDVHIDRLKPYVSDPVDDDDQVATFDDQVYLVESIVARWPHIPGKITTPFW